MRQVATESPRPKRLLSHFLVGLAGLLAAGYLGSAAILAGPNTPVKLQLDPVISSYMHPHFPQGWQLFAPDPVSDERGIIAKGRCASGKETSYLDVTTPVIEELQDRHPFPSRESRIISNGIVDLFGQPKIIEELESREESLSIKDRRGLQDLVDAMRVEQDERSMITKRALARFSAVRLQEVCEGRVDSVQLRYVIHKFPGWTDRTDMKKRGEISYVDSEWIKPE